MTSQLFRPTALTLTLALGLAACVPDATTGVTGRTGAGTLLAGKSSTTAVTTTIADANGAIAPALQIRSDQLGSYHNSSSLVSVIQAIGAWELDSYNPRNSTRTVYLDFSQPIAGSGPNGGNPIAIPSGLYKTHAIAKCNLYGTSMLTMTPGTTMPCPLHFGAVFSGGVQYAVQMNPQESSADTAFIETDFANVICTFPTSGAGPCTQWSITPSGTFVGTDGTTYYRNVGALLKYVTSKGQTTVVKEGDFYFSFSISVTNP